MEQIEMNREEFEKKLEELEKAALRLDILGEQQFELWKELLTLKISNYSLKNTLSTGDKRKLIQKLNSSVAYHWSNLDRQARNYMQENLTIFTE